ncbi:MAG: cob(I)yrinic acid a,c-diamide adenosyltransferase [Acidobacteriota bacterium]
MSIATKTGDKGETSLFTGERVKKDDKRVEAYGTMDELNSFLGDAKHYCTTDDFMEIIESIQIDLFKVCAELASGSGFTGKQVTDADVDRISGLLEGIEKKLDLKGFVLPGNSPGSAKLDICRSVARRGERRIISLKESVDVNNPIIKYVNRLSDLFFIMARLEEKEQKYV